MALKKYKPTTPSQRFKILSAFDDITTSAPEKSLLAPRKHSGGRNSEGKMTVRYRGGGHKQRYRMIDFKREKENIPATVKSIEYDPNRTARIALVFYADGEKRYVIAQNGMKVGQTVVSGDKVAPEIGNAMCISNIPLGTVISCIELRPGQGAVMARPYFEKFLQRIEKDPSIDFDKSARFAVPEDLKIKLDCSKYEAIAQALQKEDKRKKDEFDEEF